MSEVTPEMLEAACDVAAWRGDEWIHADKLPEIYLAMKALDREVLKLREDDADAVEFEIVLQEAAFVQGAQACREMLARFVENSPPTDLKVMAGSMRANWVPGWGVDPGKLEGAIPDNGFCDTAKLLGLITKPTVSSDHHLPKEG